MADGVKFILGVDLGTTSIKATLLDVNTKKPYASFRTETNASIRHENSAFALQNPSKIIQTLENTLNRFSRDDLKRVSKIAVCGQMHGCVFWKGDYLSSYLTTKDKESTECFDKCHVSDLITWEDSRCTDTFLSSLPTQATELPISTGFGCATIFWLSRNEPGILAPFDCAGTIMDLTVVLMCGSPLDRVTIGTHNAVSWGYYDTTRKEWETEKLQSAGFPVRFLPSVHEPGTVAGQLLAEYCGIPKGTPVGVTLGDFQCSVYACLEEVTNAVLNIGTSSQLAVVIPKETPSIPTVEGNPKGLQIWPFFNGDQVLVAASLTGGNVFANFVETLQGWMHELSIEEIPSKTDIYDRLQKSAKEHSTLLIRPTLWGERHMPLLKGMVSGITSSNTTLGDVTTSICYGLVSNLHEMMPGDLMRSLGVQRIVGTGSALLQNEVLQKQVQQVWGLPLVLCQNNDASFGAALAML